MSRALRTSRACTASSSPGSAQRLAEHRPGLADAVAALQRLEVLRTASTPCSRNTARRAAVSVIACPAAAIWPMNTRWRRVALERGHGGVALALRRAAVDQQRPVGGQAGAQLLEGLGVPAPGDHLRLALLEHVLDPGDRRP